MARFKHTVEFIGLVFLIIAIIASAFFLAEYISTSEATRALVEQYGLFGMIVIAFIGGLNLAVPIPAASFSPVFAAAGFSLATIVASLVVGTMIADLVGFQIGRWGKRSTAAHFPKLHDSLVDLKRKHHHLILPGIFVFAAFMPVPNEIILIPLGLMGYHYWSLAIPLALGTVLNQSMYVFGFLSVFDRLF